MLLDDFTTAPHSGDAPAATARGSRTGLSDADMRRAVRVLVVAAVRLYRDWLCRWLDADPITVVGAAPDVALAARTAGLLRPDVILLDPPAGTPAPLVRALLIAAPRARVIVLGLPETRTGDVVRWAEAGAVGYLPLDADLDDLVYTVLSVADGEMPCSPAVAAGLARRLATLARTDPLVHAQRPQAGLAPTAAPATAVPPEAPASGPALALPCPPEGCQPEERSPAGDAATTGGTSPGPAAPDAAEAGSVRAAEPAWKTASAPGRLTRREIEVAVLVCQGYANKQIATRLRISVATVKNHVHNILAKLGIDRRDGICRVLGPREILPAR